MTSTARQPGAWICVAVAALLSHGCGSDSGDGGDGAGTLFADQFDDGLGSWVATNPDLVMVDDSLGDPSPPCLLVSGDAFQSARLTLDENPFDPSEGLGIFVKMSAPTGSTECQGLADVSNVIEIVQASGNVAVAGVNLLEECGGTGYRLDYWIGTRQGETTEMLPAGAEPPEFHDLGLAVFPDGSAEWSRNGVVKHQHRVDALGPFPLGLDLGIVLRGSAGSPPFDVRFDDVQVLR